MQDRFKFRVWNKENKKLYDWNFLEETKGENTFFWVLHQAQNDCKHNILMQCTGLKDKKGNLIYEGDVVKSEAQAGIIINYGIVGFNEKEAKFLITENLQSKDYRLSFWYRDSLEVIGNIYENPELIEEQQWTKLKKKYL